MKMHALVGPDNTVSVKHLNIDPTVQTKPGWRWLPCDEVNPPHDDAKEIKSGPVVTVEKDRVVETWTVRAKSADELAQDKSAKLKATNRHRHALALAPVTAKEYDAFMAANP